MIYVRHDPANRSPLCAATVGIYLCLWLLGESCGPGAEASSPTNFVPFQIIAERNIFAAHPSKKSTPPKTPRPAVTEHLTLVGTLSSQKGVYAFFDASTPELRRVRQVGENFGDCMLTEIAFQQVKLKCGDTELTLRVGSSLTRDDAGPWKPDYEVEDHALAAAPSDSVTPKPASALANAVVKNERTSTSDPKKESRRTEKKLTKYYSGLNADLKKAAKEWSKEAGGFSENPIPKPKLPKNYQP